MRHLSIAAVLAVGLMLAGCGAQKGSSVLKADKNGAKIVQPATESGLYALYTSTGLNPIVTYELKKGDPVGFKDKGDGNTVAVAGTNEVPVKFGSLGYYLWKFQKPAK